MKPSSARRTAAAPIVPNKRRRVIAGSRSCAGRGAVGLLDAIEIHAARDALAAIELSVPSDRVAAGLSVLLDDGPDRLPGDVEEPDHGLPGLRHREAERRLGPERSHGLRRVVMSVHGHRRHGPPGLEVGRHDVEAVGRGLVPLFMTTKVYTPGPMGALRATSVAEAVSARSPASLRDPAAPDRGSSRPPSPARLSPMVVAPAVTGGRAESERRKARRALDRGGSSSGCPCPERRASDDEAVDIDHVPRGIERLVQHLDAEGVISGRGPSVTNSRRRGHGDPNVRIERVGLGAPEVDLSAGRAVDDQLGVPARARARSGRRAGCRCS